MPKQFEAPELTWIGDADEVVMGTGGFGFDGSEYSPLDFEFEQD